MNIVYIEYNFTANPTCYLPDGSIIKLAYYSDLSEDIAMICNDYKVTTIKTNSSVISDLENSINDCLLQYYNFNDTVNVEVV